MGKKSKKLENLWDLTPEQQEQQAEEFYNFEKGKTDILSMSNISPILKDNGLSSSLEELVVKDMVSKGDINLSPNRYKTNMEKTLGVEPASLKEQKVTTNKKETECRKIRIITDYVKELYRLVVDDGVSPTPISLIKTSKQKLEAPLDNDDAISKCRSLFDYMIIQKHPTAIFKNREFLTDDVFTRVSFGKYDTGKFRFVYSNGYVLCYLIDDGSVVRFNEFIDDLNYDANDTLKIYLALADTSSGYMQAFDADDEWFLEEVYNSSYNQKELFKEVFASDINTLLVPDTEEARDGIDIVAYESYDYISDVGEEIIEMLLPDIIDQIDEMYKLAEEDDEDEEDEYGEDEEPTTKVEVIDPKQPQTTITQETITNVTITETKTINTDDPVEVSKALDEEIKDLLSDDMEVVEEKPITRLETSDDDSMKVQVHRRK